MTKRKIGQILWLSLQYAKENRAYLASAWGDDETQDVVKDCMRDIEDFESLQIKLFGNDRKKLLSNIEKMKLVNILDLLDKNL